MKYEITKLGLLKFIPDIFYDYRGEYVETFNKKYYEDLISSFFKKNIIFIQDDISISNKNVFRGLHYDDCTWKLIQCLYGKIYFIVVNMIEGSKDYLQYETFILNDRNKWQILVPASFANGHLCLSNKCIFSYKQSEYYGTNQKTIKWNDNKLNINFPYSNLIMSERDK